MMHGGKHDRKVAVLLVRHLCKAMLRRSIGAAETEPYWLTSEQYQQRDGGIELLPAMAGDMVAYAARNHLRPLGVVVVNDDGQYFDYFNEDLIISPIDREFVRRLFESHAHFWFCEIPWLRSRNSARGRQAPTRTWLPHRDCRRECAFSLLHEKRKRIYSSDSEKRLGS